MKPLERPKKILSHLPRFAIYSIFVLYAIFATLSYFDYFERYLYPLHFIQGEVKEINENFYIGPYPHFDEMKRLQKETGVNVVISLLNDDLPQEKALLGRERKMADMLGIKLYSYPLTYFNLDSSRNREVADEILALVKGMEGSRIYLHCYLGRHRVNYVKDHLMAAGHLNKVLAEKAQSRTSKQ